jgi:hypothetical protein
MSPGVRLPLVEPGEEVKAGIALALQHFCEHNSWDALATPAPAAERMPAQAVAR